MLSGTNSCRIDRHSLHASALCKSSCNCNELQSGLFGMLLIFDANIWGEQTLRTTEKWQIKFLPLPMRSYPHQLSTAKPVCFLLFKMLYPSGSVSTIPCPFVLFSYFYLFIYFGLLLLSLSISLQHRVQQWLTLSNRLMLASNTTQVICLSYLLFSLTSSICPFPSPLSLSICHISRHFDR